MCVILNGKYDENQIMVEIDTASLISVKKTPSKKPSDVKHVEYAAKNIHTRYKFEFSKIAFE